RVGHLAVEHAEVERRVADLGRRLRLAVGARADDLLAELVDVVPERLVVVEPALRDDLLVGLAAELDLLLPGIGAARLLAGDEVGRRLAAARESGRGGEREDRGEGAGP